MRFEEACSEVDFIIKHMNIKDRQKIPKDIIDFFNENKSLTYRVNLIPEKDLKYQDIKEETKAFLQIIYYKCFADEFQKNEFKNIFKVEKKSPDMAITEYKENKLKRFWEKVLKFLKKYKSK